MAAKKPESFSAMRARLAKQYNTHIGPLGEVAPEVDFISTGNLAIDHILGGGFPRGRLIELYGPPSSGKAQRWCDVVHTPDRGWVQIRDLVVGDRVSDPRGQDSKVTGIHPQGELDVYRILWSDGTSAVASGDHLWEVDVLTASVGTVTAVTTTEKLFQAVNNSTFRSRDVGLPYRLPPVRTDGVELPLHPYVLGVLLGDGCLTQGTPQFSSADPEIAERVAERLPAGSDLHGLGFVRRCRTYSIVSTTRNEKGVRVNPVQQVLRDLGLDGKHAWDKFIPEMYLRAAVEDRIELLWGLMDTDGYGRGAAGGNGKGTAIYYTSSEFLASGVAEIARSLGLPTFVRTKIPTYVHRSERKEGRLAYRVEIRQDPEMPLFSLDRKRARSYHLDDRKRRRNLVSVEKMGREDCVCISVSADSSLYYTNDYIPTHNSTSAMQAAAAFQRRAEAGEVGYAGKVILYMDHENAMDPAYAKALGVDIDSDMFLFAQPDSLEDSANISRELVASGQVGLAIYDSVAAMIPKAALEAETGKASVALQARGMADFLKAFVGELHAQGTTAIFLNHLAEVIDMGGGGRPGVKRYTTPGGRALKFFASVRVEFRQVKNITEDVYDDLTNDTTKQVMATDVKVKVVKNKVAPPFKQATVRVRYGKGFDQAYSAFDVLLKYKKVIAAGGGWFYFDRLPELAADMPMSGPEGKERPALRGLSNVLRYAENNPQWQGLLVEAAKDCLRSGTDNESVEIPVLEAYESDDTDEDDDEHSDD